MNITKFFDDQDIFITGGSGFLGKALIEKILRSFGNFRKMYILMRPKKRLSADRRLEGLLQNAIFKRAFREQPDSFKKVEVIEGDCQEIGLGISLNNLKKIQNVSIIFHSAASVRFDDDLKNSVLLNTRGTYELIKIAETLRHLKAFIHVSTTFTYPHQRVIEEKIYPAYADWRTTIKLAETYDADTLNIFFSKYSSYQPNTYTFTKCLAEHIINDYKDKLPVLVFRPSIVICSIAEPVPGWLDNFNGPIGMLVACGIGILRTNYSDPDKVLDFIPVDVIAQGLIISAYKVGTRKTQPCLNEPLEVINCSNSKIRPVPIGHIIEYGKKIVRNNPFEKCLWLPDGSITRCAPWHYLRFLTIQIGLTLIVDGILRLAKRKPFLLKLQRRIHTANKALYTFICTEWDFKNENFMSFKELIPPEETYKLGIFSYADIETETVFINSVRGAKEFLLNEPADASKNARIRMQIFFILHYLIQAIGIVLILRFLFNYVYKYINIT